MRPAVYYSRVLNFPGCHRCCKFIDIFFTTNIGHTWNFCIRAYISVLSSEEFYEIYSVPHFFHIFDIFLFSLFIAFMCQMKAKFVISFVIVSMQCCFLWLRTLRHFEENTKQSLLIQAGTSFIWTNRAIFSSNNRLFNLSAISF